MVPLTGARRGEVLNAPRGWEHERLARAHARGDEACERNLQRRRLGVMAGVGEGQQELAAALKLSHVLAAVNLHNTVEVPCLSRFKYVLLLCWPR